MASISEEEIAQLIQQTRMQNETIQQMREELDEAEANTAGVPQEEFAQIVQQVRMQSDTINQLRANLDQAGYRVLDMQRDQTKGENHSKYKHIQSGKDLYPDMYKGKDASIFKDLRASDGDL